jgi:peptidoglycan/LPS O-acetylase OafA/YrhL
MIKPLTSLRFLFALLVFVSHLQFFRQDDEFFKTWHYHIFGEGFIGVSFFFILSGFILSLNYDQRLLSGKISYSEFWIARVARIYPMHIVTLLLTIPLYWNDFFADLPFTTIKFLSNAALVHAFIPDWNYFFSFNSPSWSISDEMFFYFAFPFIVWGLVRTKALLRFGWIIFLIIPLQMYVATNQDDFHKFFYINPFFRIVDFLLGITLHQLYKANYFSILHRSKLLASLAEVVAIASFVAVFHFHNSIPVIYRFSCYYWLPMALVILVFSYQNGVLSKAISNRVCILLGEISFSFYLLHQVVIKYVENVNGIYQLISNDYVMTLVMFILSLVFSYIAHKSIELPLNYIIKQRYKRAVSASMPAQEQVPA